MSNDCPILLHSNCISITYIIQFSFALKFYSNYCIPNVFVYMITMHTAISFTDFYPSKFLSIKVMKHHYASHEQSKQLPLTKNSWWKIFIGCLRRRKYFNTIFFTWKFSTVNFSKLWYVNLMILLHTAACIDCYFIVHIQQLISCYCHHRCQLSWRITEVQ